MMIHPGIAKPQPITSKASNRRWDILTDIPHIRIITVIILSLVVLIGLIRSLTFGSVAPLLLPMLATVVSIICILAIDFKERYATTYMRLGFHAGILIFMTAYPILAPETVRNIDENVRFTAGMALVLCVIGFELGYWLLRTFAGLPKLKPPFYLMSNNYSWVHRLLIVGIAFWLLFIIYAMASSGRSFYSLLFVLRGELLVNTEEVLITADENKNQLASNLFSNGRYMAAAAATILILAPNPYHFAIPKVLSWFTLVACAFIGLNQGSGGSRSSFLLSAVPLLTTMWLYAGTYKSLRQLRPLLALILLFLVYFGFQYLIANRSQGYKLDDEDVRFNVENVSVTDTTSLMAFSIYRDYEVVIGGFPDKAPFQNGASLVPLVIGWVPRRFWLDKPYPFTHVANQIMGYNVAQVSIACGLPGEGYGNFGYMGALIWGALMGLACAFADYRLSNLRPGHPLSLTMRGMMAVWAAIMVRGGTAEMFYMGVFPIGFMWICLYFSDPRPRKIL